MESFPNPDRIQKIIELNLEISEKNIENIYDSLINYSKKFETTIENLNKESYSRLIKLIEEKEIIDNFSNLNKHINELEKFKYEEFMNLINEEEKKYKINNIDEEFVEIDEDDKGFYKYKDDILYMGKFIDGYYDEGILLKKENNEQNLYIGKFSYDENYFKFKGLFFNITNNTVIFGEINNKTSNENAKPEIDSNNNSQFNDYNIKGFVFSKFENNITIYYGSIQNNIQSGPSITKQINHMNNNIENKENTHITEVYKVFLKDKEEFVYVNNKLLSFDNKFIFNKNDNFIFIQNKHDNVTDNRYKGKIFYDDCSIYIGNTDQEFNRIGEGEYHIFNDENLIIKGEFNIDKISKAKVYPNSKPNDIIFEGEFINNVISEGVYKFSEKEYFDGSFKDGMKHIGTYYYPNGSNYKGEWENDKRIGKGVYINKNKEEKIIHN